MSITLNALKPGTNSYNNAVKSGRSTGAVTVAKGVSVGSQNAVNGLKTATPVTKAPSIPTRVNYQPARAYTPESQARTAGELFRELGYTPGSTIDLLQPGFKEFVAGSVKNYGTTQTDNGVNTGRTQVPTASPLLIIGAGLLIWSLLK